MNSDERVARCMESKFEGDANKVPLLSPREEASRWKIASCYLPFDDLNVGPSEYMHCVSLVSIACNRQKISKLAHACLASESSSFARKKKKKKNREPPTNELFRA